MFKHPIQSAVETAVKLLPYGSVVGSSHTTRGHVWQPQNAEFIESEVDYRNGDSIVLTEHDPEGDLVGFKVTGPDGEILDQGITTGGHGIVELITGHLSLT